MYDSTFQYVVGEYVEVDEVDESDESCAGGLHVSNATYWEGNGGSVILECRVKLDDIITVQEGKIRCRKLYVIGSSDENVF